VLKVLKVFSVFILVLSVLILFSKPHVKTPSEAFSGTGKNKIYIINHGRHSGIVVPSKETLRDIPELVDRFSGSSHIEFGWGDKGFYESEVITTKLKIIAMLFPTESVIHAVGIRQDVSTYFSHTEIETLMLTDKELTQLIQFISDSFLRKDKDLIATSPGIYGDSQFYRSLGLYYILNTCNRWTARGLKSIGMEISPLFKVTSSSIINYIKAYHASVKAVKINQKQTAID